MYRIIVKNRGKYNNVVPGTRYCFTKRSIIDLAISFTKYECEFEVEKFIRLYNDVFCWSNSGVEEKVKNKIFEEVNEDNETY